VYLSATYIYLLINFTLLLFGYELCTNILVENCRKFKVFNLKFILIYLERDVSVNNVNFRCLLSTYLFINYVGILYIILMKSGT